MTEFVSEVSGATKESTGITPRETLSTAHIVHCGASSAQRPWGGRAVLEDAVAVTDA